MQERIIKVTAQLPDGSPIEPKGINAKWHNDYGVLAREKCKITWIDWGAVPVNEKELLWELINHIMSFHLNMKNVAKGLPFLP
jgi:hypothetical protein